MSTLSDVRFTMWMRERVYELLQADREERQRIMQAVLHSVLVDDAFFHGEGTGCPVGIIGEAEVEQLQSSGEGIDESTCFHS